MALATRTGPGLMRQPIQIAHNKRVLSLGVRTRRLARAAATLQAPAGPPTGQHTISTQLQQEALAHFLDDPPASQCVLTPTSGGVNNCCLYVDTPNGQRYVLRVYNNGNRTDKVKYEHECLRQLLLQQADLSFQVPKGLPARGSGDSHCLLTSGAECCIFELISGDLAKTTSPAEVGRATGELSRAMSKVHMDQVSPIAPYSELFRAHHAVTRDKFFNMVATNPEFDACREGIDYLASEILACEQLWLDLDAEGLPKQVIHGDLHFDNVLVVSDVVSGLLDFEFAAFDWRAMELAVALSKYVGEADPLPLCQDFVTGYALHGQLTEREIEVMPDLINLRIFSNAVYFVGRALAGEDSLSSLTTRAGSYAKRVKWVNTNRDAIVAAIKQRLHATA
eukprot:CAMPEP_0119116414 /NCGR_PEP_ID=MMETSP1180-20130426/52269_1 /TAXON_ID=3052 ORGANISM="Chlamydomonas cf sp, Strain CCMP681" /NCGR_SAMPLE_ID=MMETSP1180 /ASSEMBLY_ACC=CAM_ASM_000741 /LENGTH=393 /DNA_ID=CAMNT_0007105557 /DNA_START=17 /DNA_END=1198 /DNA_ORIENTATION=-